MNNDPAKLDVPTEELSGTTPADAQDDNDDHRTDDLLRGFTQLLATSPETVEQWLRDAAQPAVVRRLQRVCNEIRPAPLPLDVLRCSPKRAASVTSELFQQWLAGSSAAPSPLQSVSPVAHGTTANGCNSVVQRQRQLAGLAEGELFMELIRDVANELDIDGLCHKILVNVGLLTQADRGSLFLAHTDRDDGARYLEAKLFDVTEDTVAEEALRTAREAPIRIPFGVGIAGMVAETKETINIVDAYADERFNRDIDQRTGYRTQMILSMPICNYEGTVIGVAQIINKRDNGTAAAEGTAVGFSEKDVEVFGRYLTFCGIGIQNAQLFEVSVQEYRRNQILLHLARSIFEEQNNLECLVTKILLEARALLKCERCTVYLVDLDCCESSHLQKIVEKPASAHAHPPLSRRQSHNVNVEDILAQQKSQANFTMLFDLAAQQEVATAQRPTLEEFADSTLCQIAQFVANEARLRNIDSLDRWLNDTATAERKSLRATDSVRVCSSVQSLLCMPIVNGQNKVIGAVQLINKEGDQPFAEQDVVMLEAFAIFCGLGIHNTQMYENACKLMAKQKVALECLSYHATATNMQTTRLVQDTIQSAEAYALYSFKFVDFELSEDDTCRATVRMFLQCNLVQQFHIPYDVLCRWILSIRKNYRPLKYHNWRHALNVTQTMFAMMKTGKMERFVTDLEILGLLVACLCHDLDHRGTNNAFQSKTDSPLAILYTTSTMEHHHFDQCVMILNSEGNNIFQALSPEDYRRVMKIVEAAILSTDLATYFKKRNEFVHLVDNGEFDWQSEDKKELLCGMMMTACDVSAIAKPWEVQHRVAKLVADEFFDQGDMEKFQLNMQPVAMMDRERKDELPKMQVGFIDLICVPLYRMLSDTFPWIRPLYDGTMDNRQHWQDLAEKVEMGLTWIDHDTIDKPVEEFAAHPEEIADIEFTVTSLNCTPHHASSACSDRSTPPPSHPAAGHSAAVAATPVTRRQRFSSLRKTGALTKVMRSRLSRSFYSSHCDRSAADPRRTQDSGSCSVTAKIRQLSLSQAAETDATEAVGCGGEKAPKMAAPCVIRMPRTPSGGAIDQGLKMAAVATTTTATTSSRIKKRSSRLCVAL